MTLPSERLEAIRDALACDDSAGPGTRVSLDTLLDAFIAFTEELNLQSKQPQHRKAEDGEHVKRFLAKCGLHPRLCGRLLTDRLQIMAQLLASTNYVLIRRTLNTLSPWLRELSARLANRRWRQLKLTIRRRSLWSNASMMDSIMPSRKSRSIRSLSQRR